MTSANVIEYTIRNSWGVKIGEHRQHMLCKTRWKELLKFIPLESHTIQEWGYDEEEEYWENPPINLKTFVDNLIKNKSKFE